MLRELQQAPVSFIVVKSRAAPRAPHDSGIVYGMGLEYPNRAHGEREGEGESERNTA